MSYSVKIVSLLVFTALLSSCSDNNSISDSMSDLEVSAVITINNVGSSAWIVESIDGEGASAETGIENTPITLDEGKRYRFVNLGAANHPFELRDSDGEVLIAAAGNGDLQNDVDINVELNSTEGSIEFTLTDKLTEKVSTYNCQPHPSMVGDIIIN